MAVNPYTKKESRKSPGSGRPADLEEPEINVPLAEGKVSPPANDEAKAVEEEEEDDGLYYPADATSPRKRARQKVQETGVKKVMANLSAYQRIVKYLKPYKWRFITGLLFGVAFGGVNGLMILSIQHVTATIFPKKEAVADARIKVLEDQLAEKDDNPAVAALPHAAAHAAARVVSARVAVETVELAPDSGTKKKKDKKKKELSQQERLMNTAASGQGGHVFQPGILLACLMVPAMMLLRNLFGFLNSFLMLSVGMRMLQDIRSQVFAHIMGMSLDFFDQSKTGELIQLVYGRTRMIQTAAVTLASDLVRQPMSILAALAALFWVDWRFTLGVLVLFPLCLAPVLALGRMVRKKGAEEEKQAGMLTVRMQESFAGIRTIKAFGGESYEVGKVVAASAQTLKNMMRWMRALEAVGPIVEVVASIGVGAALLYAYYLGHSVEKFVALQFGMVMLYPPFKVLSRMHIMMQKVFAATDEIFELLDSTSSIQDPEDGKELEFTRGEIRFENVSFSYRRGSPTVRGINLTFEPGKYYALVGATGAGKTTLFSLLMRMYDPQAGTIYIDGQDIRTVTQKSLREHFALVNQQNFLFGDTIKNNILYGRIDASDEDVEQAAIHAHAHEFIIEQENSYDTEVGDAGQRLSGGQRQRICIARTFLKNAPILLLDEATSALDAQTEEKIKEALDDLAQGRTVISIAHRFSSLLRADEIIVMHKGRIKERGTHEELYAKGKYYKRLYDLQFRKPGLERDLLESETEEDRDRRLERERLEANLDESAERYEAIGIEG